MRVRQQIRQTERSEAIWRRQVNEQQAKKDAADAEAAAQSAAELTDAMLARVSEKMAQFDLPPPTSSLAPFSAIEAACDRVALAAAEFARAQAVVSDAQAAVEPIIARAEELKDQRAAIFARREEEPDLDDDDVTLGRIAVIDHDLLDLTTLFEKAQAAVTAAKLPAGVARHALQTAQAAAKWAEDQAIEAAVLDRAHQVGAVLLALLKEAEESRIRLGGRPKYVPAKELYMMIRRGAAQGHIL